MKQTMNPYDHIESENKKREKKTFIDNKQTICYHGGLHTMRTRKGKYIPGKIYNIMKETLKN